MMIIIIINEKVSVIKFKGFVTFNDILILLSLLYYFKLKSLIMQEWERKM